MFTIGSDIEFAVIRHGRPVSAETIIEGTKTNPMKVNGFALSHDNVLAEVATPVAKDEDGFVCVVSDALNMLRDMCGSLSCNAAEEFDAQALSTPTAMEFGCDPDYDIWDLVENDPPLAVGNSWRSCGAHVHLGHNEFTDEDNIVKLGRWMDAILGSSMTSLFDNDRERIRRRLYGRAGCVRPKPYGIEYRTLSNAWPQTEPGVRAVYRLAKDSLNAAQSDVRIEWFVDQDALRAAINGASSAMASELFEQLMAAGLISAASNEMVKECRSILSLG